MKIRLSQLVILALFFPVFASTTFAQLPCLGATTFCVDQPGESFTCIDAGSSGTLTFQYLIDHGLIKDPTISPNEAQHLIIRGNVEVEYDNPNWPDEYVFAEGSEIVMVSIVTNGNITVNPGKTLTLKKTTIHGCQFMWNQILVKAGAGLSLSDGSEIRDAATGINAEPGAALTITGSRFKGNFRSMFLGMADGPAFGQVSGEIWGNEFNGTGMLKGPYPTNSPLQGIVISSLGNATIGKSGHAPNEFFGFENTFGGAYTCAGVFAIKSGFTVLNSHFNAIAQASPNRDDAAISAYDNSSVTLSGLSPVDYTIENCRTGIYLQRSDADISWANFTNVREGVVYVRQQSVGLANSLKVQNSNFDHFGENAITAESNSSDFFNPTPLFFSRLEIGNCLIDDNANLASCHK